MKIIQRLWIELTIIILMFRAELIVVGLGCLFLLLYFTAPDQVFDDCSGVDVPAHCVE